MRTGASAAVGCWGRSLTPCRDATATISRRGFAGLPTPGRQTVSTLKISRGGGRNAKRGLILRSGPVFPVSTGAGEEIRTLDPNLGNRKTAFSLPFPITANSTITFRYYCKNNRHHPPCSSPGYPANTPSAASHVLPRGPPQKLGSTRRTTIIEGMRKWES